jgi:hypothetical protein
MAEPAVVWPDSASTPSTPEPPAAPPEPLEQRVQRLETAVAALQDTEALEERLVLRVSDRLQNKVAAEAERLAVERLAAERRASATVMMSAAEKALRSVSPLASPTAARASWIVVDVVLEFVAIYRMFFDFTYKAGWPTRILVLVLLPAILTSSLWFPGSHFWWILGDVLDKLLDLLLAFIMYKALSREAQRYLQTRSS